MTARENGSKELERLGIILCQKNPDVEPVSLTLADVRGYVDALDKGLHVPLDLDARTLEAIRFAWCAEFLDRTL